LRDMGAKGETNHEILKTMGAPLSKSAYRRKQRVPEDSGGGLVKGDVEKRTQEMKAGAEEI